ncbi:hypothetical protein ACHWQZ_G011130 [Mnemiopsis leidyi]
MSFRYHKDEEFISCNTLESFRQSLVEWNRRETNTYERVFTVFKPFSRFNWDLDGDISGTHASPEITRAYCLGQQKDLRDMKERRIAAMQKCVDYKLQICQDLSKSETTLNKSQLAKRDALIMECEIKKQRAWDYESLMNFHHDCKQLSYGKAGKMKIVGEPVDYSKYENMK